MSEGACPYLTREAQARVHIDEMLAKAGWILEHAAKVNLAAGRGVGCRDVKSLRMSGR
jgi:hypothetical protein